MREHTIKLYAFEELSEEAQARAIEDRRELEADNPWALQEDADAIRDGLAKIADKLGAHEVVPYGRREGFHTYAVEDSPSPSDEHDPIADFLEVASRIIAEDEKTGYSLTGYHTDYYLIAALKEEIAAFGDRVQSVSPEEFERLDDMDRDPTVTRERYRAVRDDIDSRLVDAAADVNDALLGITAAANAAYDKLAEEYMSEDYIREALECDGAEYTEDGEVYR